MRHGILFTDKCTQKTENAVFTVFCRVLPPCHPATAALKGRIRQCGRLTFGEHHVSIINTTLSIKKAATETAGNAAKRHRHTTAAGITAQKAANGDAKAILSGANMPHIAAQKDSFCKTVKQPWKNS